MDIFTTQRQRTFQRIRQEQHANPTKGRTSAQSNRIRRALQSLNEHLTRALELTDYTELPWLPSHYVLTDRDDDSIVDWRGVAEHQKSYNTDATGLLVDMHDHGIKATNNIAVVTTYKNEADQRYMIRKTVYSPLPCDTWNALPLTLTQWRIIAETLINTRICWQWPQAVRDYAGDQSYEFDFTVGWNLNKPRKPFTPNEKHIIYMGEKYDGEPELWTGNIIYRLGTDAFSLPTHDRPG